MLTYFELVDRLKEIKKIVSEPRNTNDELYSKLEDLWEELEGDLND
jgi:hypothetical protein